MTEKLLMIKKRRKYILFSEIKFATPDFKRTDNCEKKN